jgi:hypothetical protein
MGCAEFQSTVFQQDAERKEELERKTHGFYFRVCLVARKERALMYQFFITKHFKKGRTAS